MIPIYCARFYTVVLKPIRFFLSLENSGRVVDQLITEAVNQLYTLPYTMYTYIYLHDDIS